MMNAPTKIQPRRLSFSPPWRTPKPLPTSSQSASSAIFSSRPATSRCVPHLFGSSRPFCAGSIGRSRTRAAFPERLMRGSARLRVSRLICLCSSRLFSVPYRWVLWRTNMGGRRFCLWHMVGLFWQRPGCRSWVSLYPSVWVMQPVLGFVELRSKTITYVDRMLIIEF
jgi:hypothetical protein